SPWSRGGYVTSEVLDHTSIIRFLEQRFGVHEPNISPWRRAVCGDLTSAFDFITSDDRVPPLPSVASYAPPDRIRHPDVDPVPPGNQSLPAQERGVRPARPLPYDLEVKASVNATGVVLTMRNGGEAAAVFHTRSAAPAMQVQMFTVGPRQQLTAKFQASDVVGYHVEVHGPNGFFRKFAGSAPRGPEVSFDRGSGDERRLLVSNVGPPVEIGVVDHYRDEQPAQAFRLGKDGRITVERGGSHGWYDIEITSSG